MIIKNKSIHNESLDWITACQRLPVSFGVETVEKVNFDRIQRLGRKRDLSGCSVRDDLMLGMKRPPKNHLLIISKRFFYRLVRQREINEEKDIIELE